MSTLGLYQLHWRPSFWDDMTDDERTILEKHDRYIDTLHQRGIVVLAGPTIDPPLGMVFLQAADEAEARAIMAADPCAIAGIVEITLHGFSAGYIGQNDGYNHRREEAATGQPST